MTWLKLDDGMGNHRKTRRLLRKGSAGAGLTAFGLHALALLHCSEYLTDGFVEAEFVDETLDDASIRGKHRQVVVHALIEGGQWITVDGGWRIHDYLDHNPAKADVLARRTKDAERKARGRDPESGRSPRGRHAESERPVPSRPIPVPSNAPQPPAGGEAVEPRAVRRARDRADEQAVFDAWVTATRRTPKTLFDDKRRRSIRKGLDLAGLDACLAAVRGVARSEHHVRNPQWTELHVALRDASHIENLGALDGPDVSRPSAAEIHAAYRSAGGTS